MSAHSAESKPVVVVAEDNEDDYLLLCRAFQRAGIDAVIKRGRDGEEAKQLLCQLAGAATPALCLLVDLKMPVMDGFDLLSYVKSDHQLKGIPAVVLTTSANPTDLQRAYQLGANSYLVKPSRFETLVEMSRALGDWWLNANLLIRPLPPPTT
ncbi:MAG: response regulator [Verrucomicrobiota bacterium]